MEIRTSMSWCVYTQTISCRDWPWLAMLDVDRTLKETLGSWWFWNFQPERQSHGDGIKHWSFVVNSFWIPLTISTTKRVNTCLVPSSDSWIIQAKKMDPCTSFCSKRVCTVSCSGVPFYTHKSETHFVVIYFGMRCVVPETPKPSFAGHARLHEHIAWTLRPFSVFDSRLYRLYFVMRWTPKKSKQNK